MKTFYLGTHHPGWLNWAGIPLMVSDRRLRRYKTLPYADAPWVLDSGGFTELQQYGRWTVTPDEYVRRVRRYQRCIGKLAWAAPQDWMCEDAIIHGGTFNGQRFAGTGLTVQDHQWRTIHNWYDLHERAPEIPWLKVVQGDGPDAYLRHVDLYRAAGIDLTCEPLVGVGSVCRIQAEDKAGEIFQALHDAGLCHLHGFGLKKRGIARFGYLLDSADSLAWSFDARRSPRMEQCQEHKNCANCPRFAFAWRAQLLGSAA